MLDKVVAVQISQIRRWPHQSAVRAEAIPIARARVGSAEGRYRSQQVRRARDGYGRRHASSPDTALGRSCFRHEQRDHRTLSHVAGQTQLVCGSTGEGGVPLISIASPAARQRSSR